MTYCHATASVVDSCVVLPCSFSVLSYRVEKKGLPSVSLCIRSAVVPTKCVLILSMDTVRATMDSGQRSGVDYEVRYFGLATFSSGLLRLSLALGVCILLQRRTEPSFPVLQTFEWHLLL